MIVHYRIDMKQNPRSVAKRVAETNRLVVKSEHQLAHEEEVASDCVFHIWNGGDMSRDEFIKRYLGDIVTIKLTKDEVEDCQEAILRFKPFCLQKAIQQESHGVPRSAYRDKYENLEDIWMKLQESKHNSNENA